VVEKSISHCVAHDTLQSPPDHSHGFVCSGDSVVASPPEMLFHTMTPFSDDVRNVVFDGIGYRLPEDLVNAVLEFWDDSQRASGPPTAPAIKHPGPSITAS
jgi:hypothetical protein